LIDRLPVRGRTSIIADLSQPPTCEEKDSAWDRAFCGANAVLHLAGNPLQTASWPEVLDDNIKATWNVLNAAAAHRVAQVVFASSNWVVKGLENELAPDCYLPRGPKIGSDAAPRPVNPYGLSKTLGEIAGRMFVDQGRLQSFVAVRIGYFNPNETNEFSATALWVGADDIRALFSRCVNGGVSGFHVVYAVSAQASAPYDLTHTESVLSWKPAQRLPGTTR
jgi:nucleoside-diphosphate-sugar epimerase